MTSRVQEHFQSHRWREGGRDLTLKRLEALRILLERDLRSFMSLGPKTWKKGGISMWGPKRRNRNNRMQSSAHAESRNIELNNVYI